MRKNYNNNYKKNNNNGDMVAKYLSLSSTLNNFLPQIIDNTSLYGFVYESVKRTAHKKAQLNYVNGVGDLAYIMEKEVVEPLIRLITQVLDTGHLIIISENRLVEIKNVNDFDKFVEIMRMKYPDLNPDIFISENFLHIGGKIDIYVPEIYSSIE